MPPEDWAFFGVVRRPNEALLPYCRNSVRESTKGPALVHKDNDLERLDAISDMAHTVCRLALSFTAANQVSQLLGPVLQHLEASGAPQQTIDMVVSAKQCVVLALEGTVDAADCLARQNAGALHS